MGSMEGLRKRFPADVSCDVVEKIKEYALKIFKELNLFGVVRIDFLYDEVSNKIYVCEVNAIPGSLAYYFYSRGHVMLNEFVLRLVDVAEKNYEKEQRFNTDFVTNILN